MVSAGLTAYTETYGKAISAGQVRKFMEKVKDKYTATFTPAESGEKNLSTEEIYKKDSPAGKFLIQNGVQPLRIEPEKKLTFTHFSTLSNLPDTPENYHTVTFELYPQGDRTEVALTQENENDSELRTPQAREELKKNCIGDRS